MAISLSRRQFLSATAAGAAILSPGVERSVRAESTKSADEVAFFVVGDTHFLANKDEPAKVDAKSAAVTAALVEQLNRLPGTQIPEAAGGGKVATPNGLIHAGDCIDTGGKAGPVQATMQKTEWARFEEEFGLTGKEGHLKYPVYEVHGNHDGTGTASLAIDGIKARNKRRAGVVNVSANGLHYSWNWGPVHCVNLGIVVGGAKDVTRKRRYDPVGSLEFLVDDLASQVGESKRPVILTHHIDIARYTVACDATAPPDSKEWDPCDVHAYYEAIKGYNVAAIFYGHTHARNIYRWDGNSAMAAAGLNVFNVDNASHFASDAQACYYVTLAGGELTVRELSTKNRWLDANWTPQVWKSAVKLG